MHEKTLQKLLLLLLFMTFTTNVQLQAAENQPRKDIGIHPFLDDPLAVFLDLPRWADEDYIRQQIPVVEYVRDKELADVHIIMTRSAAGQAGVNYTLSFIGSRQCKNMENDLNYWAPATQSDYETRQGYTNMLKIGLAPYISSKSKDPELISVGFNLDTVQTGKSKTPETDPWKRWVFEIYAGGYFEAEETSNSTHIRYGFYADKVTGNWKIRLRPYFNYNEDNYEIGDSTVNNTSRRDGFDGYMLKAFSDHWAAGVFVDMLSSDYHNMEFQVETSPAIEFSLFPYEEGTRRSITLAYKLNHSYNNYQARTILDETEETLWGQSLVLTTEFTQPWGSINAGITGSHHFHDFSSNRVELFSRMDLRLFKGFALTLRADFDFINDLVSVPMGEMSTEEILMEKRRRSTNYEFDGHIGFTYTFGSELAADYNPVF